MGRRREPHYFTTEELVETLSKKHPEVNKKTLEEIVDFTYSRASVSGFLSAINNQ